ncbi:unnamed protein product, partial [Menidia menidia]
MKHSADVSVVKDKMIATFQYRQTLVQDQQNSATVFDVVPQFLDIPGLRFLADFCQNGQCTSDPSSWQTARTGLIMSMLNNFCLCSKTQMSL